MYHLALKFLLDHVSQVGVQKKTNSLGGLPASICLSNLRLSTEHHPFLDIGWHTEAKSLWGATVLARTIWSEKHSCLKFNFNVLWILFPLSCCRGSGPKTVSGWRGREKRKTKNDKRGKQWYILTWKITEKRSLGTGVGVCKWYVNWHPCQLNWLQPFYFTCLIGGHWEYTIGVHYAHLVAANFTHHAYLIVGDTFPPPWPFVCPFTCQNWTHSLQASSSFYLYSLYGQQ